MAEVTTFVEKQLGKRTNFRDVEELAISASNQGNQKSIGHLSSLEHLFHSRPTRLFPHQRQYLDYQWLKEQYPRLVPWTSEKIKEDPRSAKEEGLKIKVEYPPCTENRAVAMVSTSSPTLTPTGSVNSGYGEHDNDEVRGMNMDGAHLECTRKYRKQRTVFETHQLKALEEMFEKNQYPTSEEYDQLGSRISIDEQRLRIWFQNRRARHKRSRKSQSEHALTAMSFPSTLLSLTSHRVREKFTNYTPLMPPMLYGSATQNFLCPY